MIEIEIYFTNPSNTVIVTEEELDAMKKYGVLILRNTLLGQCINYDINDI